MKNVAKYLGILALALSLLNSACRKAEFESIGDLPDQSLQSDSPLANLLFRVSLKDGSPDNILDLANCFSIKLPATVTANGIEITLETEDDLVEIELIFEESDEDTDTLEINFPVTIIYSDYTEALVLSAEELENLSEACPGENETDEDIECVDIQYPISVSVFNPNTELFDTISLVNDKKLNDFLSNLDEDDVVNIEFPITLLLTDGSEIEISDLEGLENAIEGFIEECDEDDDNDFKDDDCNDCTVEQLEQAFSECSDFKVNLFKLNGSNLIGMYINLSFNFEADGNITASSNTENFMGTWSASGSGNDIIMTIDIPDLSDFNLDWNVNRILNTPGTTLITLSEGNGNILRYKEDCNQGN